MWWPTKKIVIVSICLLVLDHGNTFALITTNKATTELESATDSAFVAKVLSLQDASEVTC